MDKYSPSREHKSVSRAVGRSHAFRARLQRRRRRSALLATGAAIAVALAFEFSVASFGGMSMAEAASTQAKSFAELLDRRSPGARTGGVLTKTKLDRSVLADRLAAPKPVVPMNLAEVLAPPVSALAPTDLDVPVAELAPVLPPPPGAILLPPPGGGVFVPPPGGGVTPPGGGGTPPGGGGGTPPPGPPDTPPDLPPPAVPEPGTWLTMILGFGLIGWNLRRDRAYAPASSARRAFR